MITIIIISHHYISPTPPHPLLTLSGSRPRPHGPSLGQQSGVQVALPPPTDPQALPSITPIAHVCVGGEGDRYVRSPAAGVRTNLPAVKRRLFASSQPPLFARPGSVSGSSTASSASGSSSAPPGQGLPCPTAPLPHGTSSTISLPLA